MSIAGLNSTTLISTAITAAISGGTTFLVMRWLTHVEREIRGEKEDAVWDELKKELTRIKREVSALKRRLSILEKANKGHIEKA